MTRRVLLSWSSGKDSAWTLQVLRRQRACEVVGLLTTFSERTGGVAMHEVRPELVEAQAAATGLPLWPVSLPSPCPNEAYERRMRAVIERARSEGVTHVAFGDLFLEDIRDYRLRMMAGTGIDVLFPLWCTPADTANLAREMVDAGLRALLSCVDTRQLDERFAGRTYDASFLADLPREVDPCGERGEFHTFCYEGPMFANAIGVHTGSSIDREGFRYIDLLPG